MITIDGGEKGNGYYSFILNKVNNEIVRIDGPSCLADSENRACQYWFGEHICIKYYPVIKCLYEGKKDTLTPEMTYKKYRKQVLKYC